MWQLGDDLRTPRNKKINGAIEICRARRLSTVTTTTAAAEALSERKKKIQSKEYEAVFFVRSFVRCRFSFKDRAHKFV